VRLHRGWLAVVILACGCSRSAQPVATAASSASSVSSAPSAVEPTPPATPAKPSRLAPGPTRAVPEPGPEPAKVEDDDLKTEEREANPYSQTVTLKLSVTPQVKALVTWGAKQIARLSPGSMDAELSRPRGSGPVDLEIKADGFMSYHTRLYADRNDKVNVRLYRVDEAPGLLGYKRKDEKLPPEKKK
jgi:hypothetical protein